MDKFCFIMRGVPGSGKSSTARRIAQSVDNKYNKEMSFWKMSEGIGRDNLRALYFGNEQEGLRLSVIHSADDYFINDEDVYDFRPERLGVAHSKNFQSFKKSCESRISTVICDNTNLIRKEWKAFAACANNLGYIVSFVEMPLPDPVVAAKRNTHGVPLESIERMIARWEPFNGKF